MILSAAPTLARLRTVQAERAMALPGKLTRNPVRTLALEAFHSRNTALDAMFYDIARVTPDEAEFLAAASVREGDILLVPPTGSGALRLFRTPDEFLRDGTGIGALAVAGVGSSSVGSAAFARNVADALQAPVAVVVSGYGLADVMTEALGGFLFFGALNSVRHLFENLDVASSALSADVERSSGVTWARTSRDTQTVLTLLKAPNFAADLLIGHSKGNLVLSEALYALVSDDGARAETLAGKTRIVTVSAKIGMPSPFLDVLDVMGQFDGFGALNSRLDLATEHVVPWAWHSTNPDFAWPGLGVGIRVTETLKHVLALPRSPGARRPKAVASSSSALPVPASPQRAGLAADLPQILTAALHNPSALGLLARPV